MLPEAMHAAHDLEAQGISTQVASFHTVKPLDTDYLADAFARFKIVVTVEEHSVHGGFGSAVGEWLLDNAVPYRKFLRIGTPDKFYKLAGEQEFAREQLGLSGHQIAARITANLTS